MKSFKVFLLLGIILSGASSFGVHGDLAELCVGKIDANQACVGQVYEGGAWGHPTNGDFYLNFFFGEEDLWAGMKSSESGSATHTGSVVFNQFRPNQETFPATVEYTDFPSWTKIEIEGLNEGVDYFFRRIPLN